MRTDAKTNAFGSRANHRSGRLHNINFRRKRGEVDFTFGFDRGSVLSAAVRNVPDAEIAQNLVQVRGVDEHVLNGEGLHGALSVSTVASLLQPPVIQSLEQRSSRRRGGWWRRRRRRRGTVRVVEVYQK